MGSWVIIKINFGILKIVEKSVRGVIGKKVVLFFLFCLIKMCVLVCWYVYLKYRNVMCIGREIIIKNKFF